MVTLEGAAVKRGKKALVFGAGKIGRAFLAHLLDLSGYQITFVEKNTALANLLQTRGRYRVYVMGNSVRDTVIRGYRVLSSEQEEEIAGTFAGADVVMTSVGGPNLKAIAPMLAAGVKCRSKKVSAEPVNIIICENHLHSAQFLRKEIGGLLKGEVRRYFDEKVGLVETQVLRSAIEPTEEMMVEDPLSLKTQNWWILPANADAFKGETPEIMGLKPMRHFENELTRKLFTYNASNAAISYLGYLGGCRYLANAANDPEILEVAKCVASEASEALVREFGFDPEEQKRFAHAALEKYRNYEIVDPIERNARDPIRKLGPQDRLVGPATLAIRHGIRPRNLALAIAAAIAYDDPSDPSAQKLQAMINTGGVDLVLRDVCGLNRDGELALLIKKRQTDLKRFRRQT